MNHDLIERYIYAVTRRLPSKIRADVEKELRGLIEDMLEARCGDIVPTDQDLRVVLTELGTPAELAEKYLPDGGRTLIGSPYFSKYKFVLTIVLPCVAFGITVAAIVTAVTEPGAEPWYTSFLGWFAQLVSGLFSALGFITLLFAIFQWKQVDLSGFNDANLNDLPPVPKKQQIIPRSNAIAGIVFALLFSILFLAVPQIFGIWFTEQNAYVPYFNIDYLHTCWFLIIALSIFGIASGIFELYEGRYTKRLALWAVITNLASAVLFVLLFANPAAVNPSFSAAFMAVIGQDDFPLAPTSLGLLLLGVLLLALLVDTIDTLYRTFRYAEG